MTKRTVSDHTAQTIQRLREQRGWSARRLAEECARLGAPQLTLSVIANIETGRRDDTGRRRRDVTVDELMVFAYALAAPPALLLVPLTGEETTALTPDTVLPAERALRWVVGEDPPPALDGRSKERGAWERHASPLFRWRELWKLLEDLEHVRARLLTLDSSDTLTEEGQSLIQDPDWLRQFQEVQRLQRQPLEQQELATLHAISHQIERMRDEGLQPPALDESLLAEMDRFDVPRPGTGERSGE